MQPSEVRNPLWETGLLLVHRLLYVAVEVVDEVAADAVASVAVVNAPSVLAAAAVVTAPSVLADAAVITAGAVVVAADGHAAVPTVVLML
jgi:hypothetical protein